MVLSKYLLIMELSFDAILYSNTGNENSANLKVELDDTTVFFKKRG